MKSATVSATPIKATTQEIAEWVKVFPRQATETYTSSVTFMKQLTVVAVSTISYLKNIFPDENYTSEQFSGIKLKILKKKCRDELAQFLSTALTQAFDAFDKKYLKQLALCFYSGECTPENLVEYHMFEYEYSSHCVGLVSASGGKTHEFPHVKSLTVSFLRACVVVAQTASPLPHEYDICIRLYYNDDAPEGYQPPGFESSLCEPLTSSGEATIKLGYVETAFHRVSAITHYRDMLDSSTEPNPTQNPPEMTQSEADFYNTTTDDPEISCECNKNCQDEDLPLLTCTECGRRQHAVCYGVRAAPRHVCASCAAAARAPPTDAYLSSLSHKKRESLCIIRRTLQWCKSRESMTAASLASALRLSLPSVGKIVRLLERYLVIPAQQYLDPVAPLKINQDELKNALDKLFQSEAKDNTNIVGRLLAETFANDQPDPLGKVLTPMETMSLRNETKMAVVTNNTNPTDIPEDSTLKKYREAILSNQEIEEEMPLSGEHNPVKNMETIGKNNAKRKFDESKEEQQMAARGGIKRPRRLTRL